MTETEQEAFADLVAELETQTAEAVKAFSKVFDRMEETNDDKEGLSLLKLKNYEMTAYLGELTVLMSKMMKGESITVEPSVKRALKHRVFIEKMKPVEDKMKPQIEKLLGRSSAESGASNGSSKGNHRVRLDNMDVEGDEEEEEEDEDDEEGKGAKEVKKYVAPRIRAVRYEEEDEAPNKQQEKAKRRAMQSSLIMELKNQYSDAPEEIREMSEKKYQYDRERERYEEDNFTRIRLNKDQKRRSEQLGRSETLDDLLSFGDYMMRGEDGRALSEGNKRKRATSSGAGGDTKRHKKSQKERKKAAKGKKEGRKRAIRRRQ
ncbi:LiPid Depleted [Caenorhabditis elegans]|uniref:LiPid Depleted n=1 Tax=Caenorhabditis elegans TaxID=6239 RepID=Q8IG68_CAEEL|nr:LiPid Depleted [Caenorhabditis elegans]CCD64206.1 LiPid Depleted [Caenorhabditis elegans]|eukprot:NP_491806.2 LiPid Depleted [Caenorhabditis elegans]